MKRRIVAFVLAMTMIMATLAGCGSKEEASTSEAPVESSAEAEEVAEESSEPVEITWISSYSNEVGDTPDTWGEQLLEKEYNVDLTVIEGVLRQNFGAYVASGDIFDATVFTHYMASTSNFDEMIDQGVVRDIPEEWLWEYYPTGMKLLTEIVGEDYWEQGLNKHSDGKIYYVPNMVMPAGTNQTIMLYRQDWLDNLGLEVPTTLEELHDVMYAFTYDDPDGNGKDDTYGMSAGLGTYALRFYPVFGAFGLTDIPSNYILGDDGVYLTGATEEYRSAMQILQDWYAEGIVYPECVTDDRDACETKWANGTFGVVECPLIHIFSSKGSSSYMKLVENTFGEGTVGVLGALTSQYGDGIVYNNDNAPSVNSNYSLHFTATATDEQVIAVLKMLESLVNNDELAIKILYGEEGVDYTMEDDVLTIMEHVSDDYKSQKGIGRALDVFHHNDTVTSLTMTEADKMYTEKANTQETVYYNNIPAVNNESLNTYGSEVTKVVEEYYFNVLVGKDNLDAGWDAYIEKLNAAGLDKILAEYDELLK